MYSDRIETARQELEETKKKYDSILKKKNDSFEKQKLIQINEETEQELGIHIGAQCIISVLSIGYIVMCVMAIGGYGVFAGILKITKDIEQILCMLMYVIGMPLMGCIAFELNRENLLKIRQTEKKLKQIKLPQESKVAIEKELEKLEEEEIIVQEQIKKDTEHINLLLEIQGELQILANSQEEKIAETIKQGNIIWRKQQQERTDYKKINFKPDINEKYSTEIRNVSKQEKRLIKNFETNRG